MVAKIHEVPWSLDREIVLSRVLDAPRELVFEAWTKQEHLSKWFAPKGYSTNTHECDLSVGGRWRFDLLGPDGQVWGSRIVFLEVRAPELLVFDYGSDLDDDPHRFRSTITFDEQTDKKTVVTMRQLHPTKEQRDAGIGFGAVEIGYTTLEKLAEHVRTMQ